MFLHLTHVTTICPKRMASFLPPSGIIQEIHLNLHLSELSACPSANSIQKILLCITYITCFSSVPVKLLLQCPAFGCKSCDDFGLQSMFPPGEAVVLIIGLEGPHLSSILTEHHDWLSLPPSNHTIVLLTSLPGA